MLELPRPAPGVLSPSGLHFAQSSSEYSFRTRQTTRSVFLGSVPDHRSYGAGAPSVFISDVASGDVFWADDDTLLYTRPGSTSASETKQEHSSQEDQSASGLELWAKEINGMESEYRVGILPVDEAGDFKIHHVSPSEAILGFSARVYGPDRSIYNAKRRAQEIKEAKDGSVRIFFLPLLARTESPQQSTDHT